jgi:hypothetical protein
MKLSEIIEETPDIEWAKKFIHIGLTTDDKRINYKNLYKKGEMNKFRVVAAMPKRGVHDATWDPPIGPHDWAGNPEFFDLRGLEFHPTHGETVVKLPSFEKIPVSAREVFLKGVEIKSFVGLKALSGIKLISIIDCDVRCGVLRLLKDTAGPLELHLVAPKNDKGGHALSIVKKYLENRSSGDIADCMDELIEAGLKEYAKL